METVFRQYREICAQTLARFYAKHWRCEKLDKYGNRCVNLANCHDKGHQNETGKVFEAEGKYFSSFHENQAQQRMNFLSNIKSRLVRFLELKRQVTMREEITEEYEEKMVAVLHRNHTLQKYTHIWGSSHTTCFSCLYFVPVHNLYCGHIICERCLVNHSEAISGGRREITVCPLCCNVYDPWPIPWIITSKPPTAGLRILSLDG